MDGELRKRGFGDHWKTLLAILGTVEVVRTISESSSPGETVLAIGAILFIIWFFSH